MLRSGFKTLSTLMHNVLWCGIAEVDHGYYIGFYSLLDATDDVQFEFVPRRDDLLGDLADSYAVERLIWFADGYYCVRTYADGVMLHVMKFGKINIAGERELYAFSYLIPVAGETNIEFRHYDPRSDKNSTQCFRRLWTRMMGNKSIQPL